ncbi:hypothetical protein [Dongia rigui]|uniref:Uncharacterized protein n=1 Tax=Dongia rigui TaxID=940149 RepID=A0ABU5E0S5_9PROT|nr:hypothetical protein [Dongia rigui]MDY0873058.1 hypothetical protein [Dongia rigui]
MLYDIYRRSAEYMVFPASTPPTSFDARRDKWKIQKEAAPERLIVALGKPMAQIEADIAKTGFSLIRDRLQRA